MSQARAVNGMPMGLEDYLGPDAPQEERLDPFGVYEAEQELTDEERLRVKQYMEDLAAVANTPAGFRVLTHILDKLHQFDPIFTGGSHTFYNAGKYEAGRGLLMELAMADLEAFKRFQVEAAARWARNSQATQTKR